MKIPITLATVAVVLAAAGYLEGRAGRVSGQTAVTSVSYASQPAGGGVDGSPMERLERSFKMKAGSKSALGGFQLASGRRVQLYTADTEDAKSCLVEDDPEAGAGAGCLDGGLFRERRVAFSVNTQGGPERFDELYVSAVVAPSIRSVELTKSDGTGVRVALAESRAFVYESPSADLESRVYPNGFRLFGPTGKLIETVRFPPAGS